VSYFRNIINAVFGKKPSEASQIYSDDSSFIFTTNNHFPIFLDEDEESEEDSGDSEKAVSVNYKSNARSKPKDQRVEIKPINILNEIETVPTNWSLENLDDKIHVLKNKLSLIQSSNTAKREITTVIDCLSNRKKYLTKDKSGNTFKSFFSKFDTSTEEKIQEVLKKYKLVFKPSDIFIPELPKEAIDTMVIYSEKVNELCGKKVSFMIIAEENHFKMAYEKRDPILLAQSPFGFFYYILGAWDKELVILSEL